MTTLEELLKKSRAGAFAPELDNKVPDRSSTAAPEKKPVPAATEQAPAEYTTHYVTTRDQAESAVKALIHEVKDRDNGTFGVDIETAKKAPHAHLEQAGLEPHLSEIRLFQICANPETVYVFDIKATGLEVLQPLFQYNMVAHNALFELKHLYHAGITVPSMDCTLLMHNALTGKRSSLKDLVKRYQKEDISKEEQESDWGAPVLTEQQIEYAGKDAVMALKLYRYLKEKMPGRPQENLYALLKDVQDPVMKMEYHGCNCNAATLLVLMEEWKTKADAALETCRTMLGKDTNLNSPAQISNWLEKNLDKNELERWPKTETGNLETGADVLQRHQHLPFVAPLADYKKYDKLGSFGKGLLKHINPVTGRVHPSFLIGGANTGRFTCNNPNFQNIPRDEAIRSLIQAATGCKLVSADYSQVELRILAMTANESVMLKAYEDGKDLHRLTASNVSGIPFEDVTGEQRRAAKAINFGLVFGMGAKGLAEYARATYGVEMSVIEAKKASAAYFNTYPGIKIWHKQTYNFGKKYGFIKTPSGRFVRMGDKAYTRSKNAPIQAGAAEVMIAALIEMDRAIIRENLDARIVNMVHDEIVLEVAENQAEKARSVLEQAMVSGMLKIFPQATTNGLVDASIGDNWGETK
jgi:DNA polymerase I